MIKHLPDKFCDVQCVYVMDTMISKYFFLVNVAKYMYSLAGYWAYCVCWLIVFAIDYFINRLKSIFKETKMKTAQLGRILWKQKFSILSETSTMDILCIFSTRVSRTYVLRPTISLYRITKKEAIFVETPDGINIYNSDIHPFFFAAQFLNATKVIKMTLRDFVGIAEEIGDPTVPIIWMSNTGRCGGTMLCQVFESVPGTLAIHEPDSITNLHFLNKINTFEEDQYEAILKSIIQFMCRPRHGVTRFCIKPRPHCSIMMTDISRLGLNIRQVFIYRNSLDTVRSWLALMTFDPYRVVMRFAGDTTWFSNIFPYLRNILRKYSIHKMKGTPELPVDATTACIFAYSWANQILIARDAISRDRNILPIKYEDLQSQPTKTVQRLFEHTGVDIKHVERAVNVLLRDSQRGSGVSRANHSDSFRRHMSDIYRRNCDAIIKQYDLPGLGEDFRI